MNHRFARATRTLSRGFTLALLLGLAALAAHAQYPNRPLRMVVPFGPGSASDTMVRLVAEPLGTALGQTVIVDNRAGAMSVLAVEQVARSAPDGYTVVAATNSIVANPAGIMRSVNYDPLRDFTPITRLAGTSYVLVVAADQPWKTPGELMIAHALANPGKLNYASGNLGGVMYGPAGMPKEAVERLNREITLILQRPDIRARLVSMGIDPVPSTPQGLADFTRDQSQNYVRLIKEFNIQPE